jgi:hypothetical protein
MAGAEPPEHPLSVADARTAVRANNRSRIEYFALSSSHFRRIRNGSNKQIETAISESVRLTPGKGALSSLASVVLVVMVSVEVCTVLVTVTV